MNSAHDARNGFSEIDTLSSLASGTRLVRLYSNFWMMSSNKVTEYVSQPSNPSSAYRVQQIARWQAACAETKSVTAARSQICPSHAHVLDVLLVSWLMLFSLGIVLEPPRISRSCTTCVSYASRVRLPPCDGVACSGYPSASASSLLRGCLNDLARLASSARMLPELNTFIHHQRCKQRTQCLSLTLRDRDYTSRNVYCAAGMGGVVSREYYVRFWSVYIRTLLTVSKQIVCGGACTLNHTRGVSSPAISCPPMHVRLDSIVVRRLSGDICGNGSLGHELHQQPYPPTRYLRHDSPVSSRSRAYFDLPNDATPSQAPRVPL